MDQTMRRLTSHALLCCLILCCSLPVTSQEPDSKASTVPEAENTKEQLSGMWNIPSPTLGGLQFWSDVRNWSGHRIQRNSETGHYRLLTPSGIRSAWGSMRHCEEQFEKRVATGEIRPPEGHVVVLMHGLVRTSNSMAQLEGLFRSRDYDVVNVGYASSRESVEQHAQHLKTLLLGMPASVDRFSFVGHSLGNLVVRRLLTDLEREGNQELVRRCHRMVMLGPPNQGSKMARLLRNSLTFRVLAGRSGRQLARDWEELEPTLATPSFEFGIIAGAQREGQLSNFLLDGQDDFTVALEETKLPGAHDFLSLPVIHTTMMSDPEVMTSVAQFVEHGYFTTPENRNPLPSGDLAE